jgi:hypothetical protein
MSKQSKDFIIPRGLYLEHINVSICIMCATIDEMKSARIEKETLGVYRCVKCGRFF